MIDAAVEQRLTRERLGGFKPYAVAPITEGADADYGKQATQGDTRENKRARYEDDHLFAQTKTSEAQISEQSGGYRRSRCFFYMRGECKRGEHCDRPHIAAKDTDICPFREHCSFGEKCKLAATHEH